MDKENEDLPWWVGFTPPELFRYKRTPKGGPVVAFCFSMFVLIASTIVLTYVAYVGSQTYNTESKITTTDMTDNVWSCEMVSLVTDEFVLNNSLGTSFTLVNIMESLDDCLADINKVTNRCESGLSYSPTSSTTKIGVNNMFMQGTTSKDILFFGVSNGFQLSSYNYASGLISVVYSDIKGKAMSYTTVAMAYDSNLDVYWKYDSDGGAKDIVRAFNLNGDSNFTDVLTFSDGCTAGSMVVDTSTGDLYFARLCYSNYANVYKYNQNHSPNATFVQRVNVQFNNAAQLMYCEASSTLYLTVFMGNYQGKTTSGFEVLEFIPKNNSFVYLFSYGQLNFINTHVTVDPYDTFWFIDGNNAIINFDKAGNELGDYNPEDALVFELGSDNNLVPTDLTFASSIVVDELKNIKFVSSNILYLYDTSSSTLYDMKTNEGSTSWFICGDKLQQGAVPTSTKGLATACAMNGYQWQYDWENIHFFENSQMDTYATTDEGIVDLCNQEEIVQTMCDRVSDLPPYLCTRKIKEATVTYLGAAAGFANLVYTCLVLIGSISLSVLWPLKRNTKKEGEGGGSYYRYTKNEKDDLLLSDEFDLSKMNKYTDSSSYTKLNSTASLNQQPILANNSNEDDVGIFSPLRVADYNRMDQEAIIQRLKQQDEMIQSLHQRLISQGENMIKCQQEIMELKHFASNTKTSSNLAYASSRNHNHRQDYLMDISESSSRRSESDAQPSRIGYVKSAHASNTDRSVSLNF